MKQFHFSTAECYDNCPYKFELTYLQELKTIPSDDPQNPLILGTAIHKGMETDLQTAIQTYMNSYPIITDEHINEIIKMEHWIPRMKEVVPEGFHEVTFSNSYYMGTADLLVPVENPREETFDLYDYKYSNNQEHYMESRQLHVYKHYLEHINGIHIRKMFFVFVPKVMIRQGHKENIQQFRHRLQDELNKVDVQIREVIFNQEKVDDFHHTCMKIATDSTMKKNFTNLCDWCEFKDFCKKGQTYMLLPSSERRQIEGTEKKKIYIYGDSFTGKTTLVDQAPNPINLNTDGNITQVTMPYLSISDRVTTEGRITKTTLAWEVLKEAIAELQKTAGENGYKTIVIDLVEDAYESCRLYMYQKLGIEHESDDAFRAWDKVRTEFFSTMRSFFNLPYDNLIIISKEDKSRDITRKSGDRITQIKPNLQDKIANKLAGMVDIVVRAVVEDDGKHTLQFKTNEVVFGGGRLKYIKQTTIPCTWDALMKVYEDNAKAEAEAEAKPTELPFAEDEPAEPTEPEAPKAEETETPVEPVTRHRRRRTRKED